MQMVGLEPTTSWFETKGLNDRAVLYSTKNKDEKELTESDLKSTAYRSI